ncbi:SixA phosphatase family protein [Denitratisoma oestradiolicum]|uniref:L518 n=1 Tax=Denitratisoma oestradiolicum TaxID=311182 RepID=A0A6S6YLJ6_9PROT|nr:histidine phosphatase family protein [Denitratisoma oestradiolicum]TWO81396.1 histidine phosphatase family protein [Denitratisoma oestradiolicum]CAB1368594.1 L518 [Denitratisoma oestradiolicum]
MDILLWRHADAEEHAPGLDDLARKLTTKGQRQAAKVARWLDAWLPRDTRILVSPAQRARETAHALRRTHEVEPAIAPDATVADLLRTADWPRMKRPVLLVGHQPTLGQLAALLVSGREDSWPIRKGAVWWLSTSSGETLASVRTVIDPRLLD